MNDVLARRGRGETRGLIVTASDLGLAWAINEAVQLAAARGNLSGAALNVVAPFARDAVDRVPGDIGVQLVLNAEHERLEMRPVTYAPSLLGGRGGFPLDAADAAEHADPDEVRREFRAQIERAISLGVTPTFLASHDDVVAQHLALFDVFLDVADEYRLPIRHGYDFAGTGLDAAELARQRGHFVADATVNWSSEHALSFPDLITALPTGVSEVIVTLAVPSRSMNAVLADGARRADTFEQFSDLDLRELCAAHGVTLLTWGEIAQTWQKG